MPKFYISKLNPQYLLFLDEILDALGDGVVPGEDRVLECVAVHQAHVGQHTPSLNKDINHDF